VVTEFLREFVFDVKESDEIIEQVNRLDRNQREGYLSRICGQRYQGDSWCVRHEITKHGVRLQDTSSQDMRNSLGYFKCQDINWGLVFKTKATLKRHHQKQHGSELVITSSNPNDATDPKEKESKEDYKFNYHKAKMCFGLLLADLNDSIREGDGKRLVNLYKIAVLLYKYHGHTKYAYTTLLFLTKVKSILPAERAESLIANRFCNSHGKPGKNISMDLFLEHKNKSVKSYSDLLGSNFKEESAQRIARATGINDQILFSVDVDCKESKEVANRSQTDPTEAVQQVVADLLTQDVFIFTLGREGYPFFPKISANLVSGMDYRDLYQWIQTRLDEWAKIYEH